MKVKIRSARDTYELLVNGVFFGYVRKVGPKHWRLLVPGHEPSDHPSRSTAVDQAQVLFDG